jgi:hypothetical protein
MSSLKERVLRVLEGLPEDAAAAEVEAAVRLALCADEEPQPQALGPRTAGARQSEGSRRRRSDIYLHLVWATYRRLPVLAASIEQLE